MFCYTIKLGDWEKILVQVVKLSLLQNNCSFNYFLQPKERLMPYWKCMESAIPEDVRNKTIAPPKTYENHQRSAGLILASLDTSSCIFVNKYEDVLHSS